MESHSFPGPVFQRLHARVDRPLPAMRAGWGEIGPSVLLRCAMGLGAAVGAAQLFGLDERSIQAGSILAAVLFLASSVSRSLGLRALPGNLGAARNPDSPWVGFTAVAVMWGLLILVQLVVALLWSPHRVFDMAVGVELCLVGPFALWVSGALTPSCARRSWKGRTIGAGAALSGVTAGVLLFGGIWAVAGEPGSFSGPQGLLIPAALATAAHWFTARRLFRRAGRTDPRSLTRLGLEPGPALLKAYALLAFAPGPVLLALAGLLGSLAALFFFPALLSVLGGMVLERMLVFRLAEPSVFFGAVGAVRDSE